VGKNFVVHQGKNARQTIFLPSIFLLCAVEKTHGKECARQSFGHTAKRKFLVVRASLNLAPPGTDTEGRAHAAILCAPLSCISRCRSLPVPTRHVLCRDSLRPAPPGRPMGRRLLHPALSPPLACPWPPIKGHRSFRHTHRDCHLGFGARQNHRWLPLPPTRRASSSSPCRRVLCTPTPPLEPLEPLRRSPARRNDRFHNRRPWPSPLELSGHPSDPSKHQNRTLGESTSP
jgi:hypothetical protein